MKPILNLRRLSALVLLLAMAVSLFAGCGEEPVETTAPAESTQQTEATEQLISDDYVVLWNKDRATYEGKAEDGISTGRKTNSDGTVNVDLVGSDGVKTYRVKTKRIATSIDSMDLVVLEQDEDGIVTGAVSIFDGVPQVVANMYYVTAVKGMTVETNTSESRKGMKVSFTMTSATKVYDVSGETTPFGASSQIREDDRVTAIANSKGEITDVFIVTRVNLDVEQLCPHCQQTVVFKGWESENSLPVSGTGHYVLLNNVKVTKQQSTAEGAQIVLDLNGFTVTSNSTRVYSVHNEGGYLGIMDSSEAQTGKLKTTGELYARGGCVWLFKGNFDLFSGTLDASEVVDTSDGAAVSVSGGTVCNIYGGKIIGGKTTAADNGNGKVEGGRGGAIHVMGQLNMSGGTVTGGEAVSLTSGTDKVNGYGGSVYIGSTGVFNMTGGTVTGGVADNGEALVHVMEGGTFNKSGDAKVE